MRGGGGVAFALIGVARFALCEREHRRPGAVFPPFHTSGEEFVDGQTIFELTGKFGDGQTMLLLGVWSLAFFACRMHAGRMPPTVTFIFIQHFPCCICISSYLIHCNHHAEDIVNEYTDTTTNNT